MKRTSFVVLIVGLFAVAAFAQGQINGGILNGKATSLPAPEYPAAARAAGMVGIVRIAVTIDEAGNVVAAEQAEDSSRVYHADGTMSEGAVPSPLLVDAALQAALQAKFSPTMLSGSPVRVHGVLVYTFRPERTPVSGTLLSGGVLNGKAISLPMPGYPPAARAVRASGAVTVRLTVDELGNVTSAEAISGHPLLRSASVEAAKGAKFNPTLVSGQPVSIAGVIVYNFTPPAPKEQ